MLDLVQNVFINVAAQLLWALLVGWFSTAKHRLSGRVMWFSNAPKAIKVLKSDAVIVHEGRRVDTLVELTFMLQFGRINSAALSARESIVWKSFGKVIGARRLAEYRCNSATVVSSDDTVTVVFEGLKPGARAIIRVLCDVYSMESYGQIGNRPTHLRVEEKSIRTPRWDILTIAVLCSVIFSTTVYELMYAYLTNYNDRLSFSLTLTFSCIVVFLLIRHYSVARWCGFWWAFGGGVPIRQIFRRDVV